MTTQDRVNKRYGGAVYVLVLVAVAMIAYGSALSYPFVQDDFEVLRRSQVGNVEDFLGLFKEQIPFLRPVSTSLYFGIGQMLWGMNPRAFHAVNLLTYILSAWLLKEIVTRQFQNVHAGRAVGLIFLTTCGHLLGIYWVCVMTQGALVFWFLLAWFCDQRAWETKRLMWRVAASVAFLACTFSNITGPTLAVILTVAALLRGPRPTVSELAKQHWPLYAAGLLLAYVQFILLGWQSFPNYALQGAEGNLIASKVEYLVNFSRYAVSPLYLAALSTPSNPWLGWLAGISGLLAICGVAVVQDKGKAADTGGSGAPLLLGGALVIVGVAPYLVLRDHFHASHVSISAIGLAMIFGHTMSTLSPRWLGAACLGVWIVVSVVAIRLYERAEWENRGVAWKAELSRNVLQDTGEILRRWPQTQEIVITNPSEHLWWFFTMGRIHETHFNRPDVVVSDGLSGSGDPTPGPAKVIVWFDEMHLKVVSEPVGVSGP